MTFQSSKPYDIDDIQTEKNCGCFLIRFLEKVFAQHHVHFQAKLYWKWRKRYHTIGSYLSWDFMWLTYPGLRWRIRSQTLCLWAASWIWKYNIDWSLPQLSLQTFMIFTAHPVLNIVLHFDHLSAESQPRFAIFGDLRIFLMSLSHFLVLRWGHVTVYSRRSVGEPLIFHTQNVSFPVYLIC